MLILKRKVGQRVWIKLPPGSNGENRDICVTLVEAGGHSARIGFQAPLDIRIDREELTDAAHQTLVKQAKADPGASI